MHMMSEGYVEDYFGAWCADDGGEGGFDADSD